ncbi:MAG: hypothetical protein HQ589_02225 [Syntrophaceae bacterium]|nr:hypothetical protein [Syntrophaceae bacterium]
MDLRAFKPCRRKPAIQAFLQDTYYLIGCHFCGTCFSITHDFQHFLQQIMASHEMTAKHPLNYDVMAFNRQIIFMLP